MFSQKKKKPFVHYLVSHNLEFNLVLILQIISGRALEDLRSSLYNELRTSEGAKRQQQRFCGPVEAMAFNFMVSVCIILANKLVSAFSLSSLADLLRCIIFCPVYKIRLTLVLVYVLLQVMGKVGFNFPIFLTLIHYTTAWFLLAIFKAFSLLPVSPPSKTTPFSSLFSLGAVMAFASGLANTSLKHNRF